MERSLSTLLRTLTMLRWLAVIGQSATIAVVLGLLGVALNAAALWAGVAALVAFNLWAAWRIRRIGEPSHGEVLIHIGVDVAVLAWLIAWSGGVTNPFTSLFLLPIAFASLALPVRWIHAVAAMCCAGYAASVLFGQPLPHIHGMSDGFDLHLWGMAANFVVSALVLLIFFARMSELLRRREHELSLLRERFTRNEGIVALATHAASVAHELNTPLATMTLMLDDLIEDASGSDLREDHATLRALVDVCRDRVRELAAPAEASAGESGSARVDIETIIARWQLVRPTVKLVRSGKIDASTRVVAAVGHLLQALLNNAADAGEAAGMAQVDLKLEIHGHSLHGEIRDYGAGFGEAEPFLPSRMFASSKPDGLGVGLALSHATVERLNGELSVQKTDGRGVRVCFELPLANQADP
ncbi:MAG: HAMP domain-containing histidine kinase [Xanthomonadales bacterium]|nr:HAMP domain-containing histidine kinase [Xanthomonadales bacterium]